MGFKCEDPNNKKYARDWKPWALTEKKVHKRNILCGACARSKHVFKRPVYEQMVSLGIEYRVAMAIADGSPTRLDVGKNESV